MRNNKSNDDVLLESYRRYLLGELDEEEAKDFELQLLQEADLPVEALESDLLAACARKEFPTEQERQILNRLTSSPPGRDRLALVRGLTTLAHESEHRPWNNVKPLPPRPPQTERRSHFLKLKTALAATLLIAVGGVPAWMVIQSEREELPPVVFQLPLNIVRSSDTIPTLAVSSGTERVEIRIDVVGEEYPSYKLMLTDVESEKEVAKESGVRPIPGGDVLSLKLQASKLPEGEYQLYVYGTKVNGPPELLGAPEFEVLQSD